MIKENILKTFEYQGQEFKLIANYWDNDPCDKCCFADEKCDPFLAAFENEQFLKCELEDEIDCFCLPIDQEDV